MPVKKSYNTRNQGNFSRVKVKREPLVGHNEQEVSSTRVDRQLDIKPNRLMKSRDVGVQAGNWLLERREGRRRARYSGAHLQKIDQISDHSWQKGRPGKLHFECKWAGYNLTAWVPCRVAMGARRAIMLYLEALTPTRLTILIRREPRLLKFFEENSGRADEVYSSSDSDDY